MRNNHNGGGRIKIFITEIISKGTEIIMVEIMVVNHITWAWQAIPHKFRLKELHHPGTAKGPFGINHQRLMVHTSLIRALQGSLDMKRTKQ